VVELKAGDVIDIVEGTGLLKSCPECLFHGAYNRQVMCNDEGIMFKLRTGPKQGDTVWIRNSDHDKWTEGVFVSEFNSGFVIKKKLNQNYSRFKQLTTIDPYALKYTLTAQQALIAIGQGKRVKPESNSSNKIDYLYYNKGLRVMWYNGNDYVVEINPRTMYAIVEK